MSSPRSFLSALVRAWRSLTRRPAFFAIAVSSLAIALGLATTVIAQIDSLLHPVVAMRDADRLFGLYFNGVAFRGSSALTAEDVASALRASPSITDVSNISYGGSGVEIGGVRLKDISILEASRDYFDLIGTAPIMGRLFDSSETSGADVAMVSKALWRRYFGNRRQIDNASLYVYQRSYRVVGVLPAVHSPLPADIVLPMGRDIASGSFVVRVTPSTTASQLDSSVVRAADLLAARFGDGARRFSFKPRVLKPDPLHLTVFHRALAGAAIFILIIACANVSALMLARSIANRRNQALRLALGAGTRDLLREVAAEVVILAVAGGVLGVVIADWTMRIMIATTPPELGWMGFDEPEWSVRVFVGLLIAVAATVGLSALIPAWHASRVDPADPLKDNSGTTTGRPSKRFQVLVVAELALAMVLLFGASLITKTANNVAAFDFGYNARPLFTVQSGAYVVSQIVEPDPRNRPAVELRAQSVTRSDFAAMVERVRALPGVADASWILPDETHSAVISDATYSLDKVNGLPEIRVVGPGFLRTLGIPLLAGREFIEGDIDAGGAVILDEPTARALFPQANPIGAMVSIGRTDRPRRWRRVVGVAGRATHELPEYAEIPSPMVVYVTTDYVRGVYPSLIVRPKPGVTDAAPPVVALVRANSPTRARIASAKWIEHFDEALAARRFIAGIFLTLSVASLALAAAGLFGVMSYAVLQRMREFSVRVALGARAPNIVRLVVRDGLVMALGGTAIGGFIGLGAGFAVYDWLWGVYPVDAGALIAAEIVLIAVTMAATTGPALRAARANPLDVMRAS